MTPELTDADRDAISAIVDREGRPESTYNAIALHFKAIGRAEAIAEAARDTARLDWLEGEMEREKSGPFPRKFNDSLFRRNMLITRAAIDAAIDHALG